MGGISIIHSQDPSSVSSFLPFSTTICFHRPSSPLHPQWMWQRGPCIHRTHVLETSQFHKQLNKQLMPTRWVPAEGTWKEPRRLGRGTSRWLGIKGDFRASQGYVSNCRSKNRSSPWEGRGMRCGLWREAGRVSWRTTLATTRSLEVILGLRETTEWF